MDSRCKQKRGAISRSIKSKQRKIHQWHQMGTCCWHDGAPRFPDSIKAIIKQYEQRAAATLSACGRAAHMHMRASNERAWSTGPKRHSAGACRADASMPYRQQQLDTHSSETYRTKSSSARQLRSKKKQTNNGTAALQTTGAAPTQKDRATVKYVCRHCFQIKHHPTLSSGSHLRLATNAIVSTARAPAPVK